ncbi:hypothetical protein ACI3LZ_003110, partial [Candidozyma auris]
KQLEKQWYDGVYKRYPYPLSEEEYGALSDEMKEKYRKFLEVFDREKALRDGKGLSYSPKVVSALDDNLDGRIRYGLRHAARVAFISLGPSKEYEDQFDWKDQSSASEGEFNTRWNDWKGLYSMSTDARLESIVAFGSMIAGNKRLSGILRVT